MIQCLRDMEVDFVVGGRRAEPSTTSEENNESTVFVTGQNELEGLPSDMQEMFLLLDESDFRVDVSSTELRAQQESSKKNDKVDDNDDEDDDDVGGDDNDRHGAEGSLNKKKTQIGRGQGASSNVDFMGKIMNIIASFALIVVAIPTFGLSTCEANSATVRPVNNRFMILDDGSMSVTMNASLTGLSPFLYPRNLAAKNMVRASPTETTSFSSSSSGEQSGEVCTPIEKCQQCTYSEQKDFEACKETGRWEKLQCATSTEQTVSTRTKMMSCKYTDADQEFAMVRLQMLCFVIGSIAIMSVRKHKRLSVSLFDQRKQGGLGGGEQMNGTPSKKNSMLVTANDEEIEFTPMTNQEREKVPLMEIIQGDLEVV
jgi:hypothetical protein